MDRHLGMKLCCIYQPSPDQLCRMDGGQANGGRERTAYCIGTGMCGAADLL